jgi:transcriptional regulator with XRE-family HTH domain
LGLLLKTMDPIADRILKFLQDKGISKSAFADAAGLNKASLSHIESGRNKVSLNIIESFAKLYPEVDLNWLIQGVVKSNQSESDSEISSPIVSQDEVNDSFPEQTLKKTRPKHIEKEQEKQIIPSKDSDNEIVVLFSDGTYKSFRPK